MLSDRRMLALLKGVRFWHEGGTHFSEWGWSYKTWRMLCSCWNQTNADLYRCLWASCAVISLDICLLSATVERYTALKPSVCLCGTSCSFHAWDGGRKEAQEPAFNSTCPFDGSASAAFAVQSFPRVGQFLMWKMCLVVKPWNVGDVELLLLLWRSQLAVLLLPLKPRVCLST